jgi:hypothetical protein
MKASAIPLKQALLNEYVSFSDKRIKNIEKGSRFFVDDRSERGLASDGLPYGWFCTVVVDVLDAHSVRVTLGNSIPQGPTVTAWAAASEVALTEKTLQFTVTPDRIKLLTGLAEAFLGIVAPNARRYDVANYKYACPRVAKSLKRLADVLARVWSNGGLIRR